MTTPGRKSIVLISAFDAPFISEDAGILESGPYRVTRLTGSGPFAFLRAVFSAVSSDLVFCWLLSVYGAAAVMAAAAFGRRSVVVLGGVDVARDPELGYGLWLSGWKSIVARRALRKADRVLIVAAHMRESVKSLAGVTGENITYLPTGYDPDFWTPGTSADAPPSSGTRRRGVLCVAGVSDSVRARVKGIDVLFETARSLPGTPFTVVGVDPSFAATLEPPPNVSLFPPAARHLLLDRYRGARVYCQPSRHEGLPNALCEAMLCGCVPAVTDAGDSAHAVGAAGFVARAGDPASLAAAVRSALDAPASMGSAARERIVTLFPAAKRREDLLSVIGELV